MQAAACCLTAHGLPAPLASASIPPGLEQGTRYIGGWGSSSRVRRRGSCRAAAPGASPAGRAGQGIGARCHPPVSPQARAAEGDGGPGKALPFFQHPVRLLWPKSKAFDHLYSVGEKLLENFPVQATLFFYEDSGSEEEEEEEEERDDEEEEATGDVTAGHPRNAGSLSRPA
nr:protein ripply1 [Taeniopygia guttata]